MRKLTNARQKLIINRKSKGQTPPKLQIKVRNGATAVAWAPALSNKSTNIAKLNNSSILRKQSSGEVEKKEMNYREMIRCRSISAIDIRHQSKSKFILTLPVVGQSLQEKCTTNSNSQETIHQISRNLLAKLKEKGVIILKNSYYTMYEQLLDVIAQIVEKFTPQPNKTRKNPHQNSQMIKTEPETKMYEAFNIVNQYCIQQTYRKERKLTQHSRIVDEHQAFEETTSSKETFWRIISDYQIQKPTQQNLIFLLNKIKYLKQQASQLVANVQLLNKKIEQLNTDLSSKEQSIEAIQKKRAEKAKYLQEIEQTAVEMKNFINKQPNRILQQQAREYKLREQELFDLAFLYQQQFPSQVRGFIEESIMIPFESLKLTIASFPHYLVGLQDDYTISKKSLDDFKASIKSAYQCTIEKLTLIIERKASKIKNFVGIMRRLASYTIGKRQYLSEINKKMSVVSIHIDKSFKDIENKLVTHGLTDDALKKVDDLKQLFHNIKNIYCEAQVFY